MGVTAFMVERDTPGLVVGEHFDKIGLKTTPVSSVTFDDCYVPAANRVGAEGQGAGIFTGSMGWERACLFAQYVGLMDRQIEEVVGYVKQRKQFGKPLSKFQAVAHKVADMKLRVDAARLLLYRACWLKDQGIDATLEIAESKIAVSEGAVQSGLDAIQLFGGAGVRAGGIEHMLRDAIPSTIFSGTSEIQRDLIARGVGL
jgi:alkylation response protein AidB-like acyl-CoA dehydrogenase